MPRNGAARRPIRRSATFAGLAACCVVCVALLASALQPVMAQDDNARLAAARVAMGKQRLDKAMKEIDKALAMNPANADAWKLKGEVALRQADLDGALEYWTEASRLAPDDIDLLIGIGDLLIRRNDRLDDALDVYSSILDRDPQNTRILVSMGSIHERRGKWEAAAEMYRAALTIDPNLVRARGSLGAVLFKIGHYEEASRELRKAIELSPRDLRSHVFLGLAQNHLGQYDLAIEELRDAVLIDPHSAAQLIGVREQQAQFMRLADLCARAYEESPLEAGRSYDLAVIYFYAQDYESSWRFLRMAEKLRFPVPVTFKEVVYSKRKLRSP